MANSAQRKKDRTQRELLNLGRDAKQVQDDLVATRAHLEAEQRLLDAVRLENEQLRSKLGEQVSLAEKLQIENSTLNMDNMRLTTKVEVKEEAIDRYVAQIRQLKALEDDLVAMPKLRKRLHQQREEIDGLARKVASLTRVFLDDRRGQAATKRAGAELKEAEAEIAAMSADDRLMDVSPNNTVERVPPSPDHIPVTTAEDSENLPTPVTE